MNTDLAWLAGVLDGEGSISLHQRNPTSRGIRTPVLQVQVYGNDGPVIDKVRKVLGEHSLRYSVAHDRRTPILALQLCLSTHPSLALYPLVSPYLVRQIDRYTAAYNLITAHYARGVRFWRPEDIAAWADLRRQFGVGA